MFALTQAQSNLFKGIKSGMSETKYLSHCKAHPDMEYVENNGFEYFLTTIEGREYLFAAYFNKKNKLQGISFLCSNTYEWMDYDVNVMENALELFVLLEARYGDPTFDEWVSWTEIPKGKEHVVASFEKGTINSFIMVKEDRGEYSISLVVGDIKYTDIKSKNTGGF